MSIVPPPLYTPSLPPELWIRILTHHTDLVHLWHTCRQISPTFRAYVEQVFASTHLRTTIIEFHLDKHNLGGKGRRPELPATYSHFSRDKDKKLVYFADKRAKKDIPILFGASSSRPSKPGPTKQEFDMIIERWEDRVRSSKPEMPNYTLRLGRMVNDTPLPALALDVSRREISFDWRAMFSLFFREQARLRTLKERYPALVERRIAENKVRLAKGEHVAPEDLPKPWSAVETEMRKRIRRERLKEQYAGDEEMLWAIGSLKFYENSRAADGKVSSVLSEILGAGLGERWFGSTYRMQALYLDEWSCLHRIEGKMEQVATGGD